MTTEIGLKLTLQGRREAAAGLAATERDLNGVADAGRDVGEAGRDAARGLEKASDRRFARGFSVIGRGAGSLARTLGRGVVGALRGTAIGLGVVGVAAAGVSVKAVQLSSDAAETASAFDTVFGPSAQRVGGVLDGLTERFGIYNPELQDAARGFGVFGKAAGVAANDLPGFSTSLVQAGLDLSSFYNTDPGETFDALRAGLTGETEPLRKFGIFISDATLKARAATMGLTGELSDQQKVMIRQKLIMEGLGDAQGDLERTSRGYANQQRGASGRIKEFTSLLGGPMKIALTGAMRGFNAFAKSGIRQLTKELPSLNRNARETSWTFTRWGRQMARELPNAIKRVRTGWDELSDRIGSFSAGGSADQLGVIADNVTRMGPAFEALASSGIEDTLTVTGVVTGFLADHTGTLAKWMPVLVGGYIALKASQIAGNIVLAASLPLKIAEYMTNRALVKSNQQLIASRAANTAATVAETGATTASTAANNVGLLARARAVVGIVAHKVASIAAATATKVMAAGQWLLNAALTANPIGLVIVAIAALAAGFFVLYKKSETFRGMVDGLWTVLKPLGAFVGKVLVAYLRTAAMAWLTMGIFGVRAFRWLLTAAFKTFDGILSAADKGLGWLPGVDDKIKAARAAFDEFGDATISKLKGVEDALVRARDKANELGRDREATITITTVYTGGRSTAGERAPGFGPESVGGPASRPTSTPSPRVQQRTVPDVPDVDASLDLDPEPSANRAMSSRGSGAPATVNLNVDGKTLASVVLDEFEHRGARRGGRDDDGEDD